MFGLDGDEMLAFAGQKLRRALDGKVVGLCGA